MAAAGPAPRVRQDQKAWKTIHDINSASSADMNRLAIWDGRRQYTYGQMFRQWERYAAVFSALGMTGEKRARVGLLGSMGAETIFALYGLNMVGAEVSLIGEVWTFRLDRVIHTIREEGLTDFIVTDMLAPPGLALDLLKRKDELGLRNVLFLHLPVGGPAVKPALSAAQEAKYLYLKSWYAPVCMDALLKAWGDGPVRYAPYESSDSAFIVHTSGTTGGTGKPVVLSDRAFNAAGACFARLDFTLPEQPVSGLAVDLSNVFGAVDQVHVPLSLRGTIAVAMGGAFNPEFHRLIPAAGVNFLFAVNAMFEQWIRMPEDAGFDFSNLRFVALGGAAVSAKDKRRYLDFMQKHGGGDIALFNGYGVSELGGACCLSSPDVEDESIGYLLPGVELRLWNEEKEKFFSMKNAPCEGVLYLHSNAMATPTLDGRTITETVTLGRRLYVCTNDAVRVDADGKITYLGRANRYFIHGGCRYESGRVETEFARQQGIESCCVAPVFDKSTHDNCPMLCVKPLAANGAEDTVRRALLRVFCAEKTLPADQIPARVLITEELPRNASGKIDLYRISRGEVSGKRYLVEKLRLLDQIVDFRLTELEDGPTDMIQDTLRRVASDMKDGLLNSNKNKTEDENTMKKTNPIACFNAMNQMGSQMMSNLFRKVKAQSEGKNPFADMQEKMAPGMKKLDQQAVKQMSDMLEQMNKANQKGWEAMEKIYAQNQCLMEKISDAVQKMAEKAEEGAEACEEACAEESAE